MFGTTLQAQVLNELLISTTNVDGADVEYVEIYGEPGTPLLGLSVIGVESDDQSDNGEIDFRFDFGADDVIGSNGFYLIGTSNVNTEYSVTPNKIISNNSLENSSATYGLVVTSSITGSSVTGGEFWRDVVAVTDGEAPEFFYFDAPVIGPDGTFLPAGVRRVTDGADTDMASDWVLSDFGLGSDNTPTAGTPMMAAAPVASGCEDLFLSEYMEGSGNNKCIEIYNPTSSSIDLNAGNYQILIYFGGSSSASTTINLTGTIASGATYTLCDNDTDFSGLGFTADQTSTSSFFNGDDAVELRADGTTLDVFGQIGCDPGSQWGTTATNETQNQTLRRNSSVTAGVSTNPGSTCNSTDGFPTLQTEWTEFPNDDASGLGSHTFDGCSTGGGGGSSTCGFTNVSFFNLECGTGSFAEEAFFDVSATVTGGSGSYRNINPETSINYGNVTGVENGPISGTGAASVTGPLPGEVAKIELLDQMNTTCRTPTYYFRVPECVSCPTTDDIFISEFHYDNAGGDVNEFVEVAVSEEFEGDLSTVQVTLYRSNGTSYDSETLDNLIQGSMAGGLTYYHWDLPTNGIFNSSSGIALECNGSIFQLLSYEGTFDVGITASTDVGVSEDGDTPEAGSLQLIDGVWTETCQNTKGDANADVDCCEDPTFECLDNDVLLDFGSYNLTEADVVDIDNQDNPSDCPAITLGMISPSTLDCDDLDNTVMVTVMVNTPEGPQSCTANITVVDESGELPTPWSASDVGEGTNEFSYDVCNANNGEFSLTSGGRNFPLEDDSDNTGFISQEICGDASITVKVESRQGGFPGITIRESTAAGAKMFALFTNLNGNVYSAARYETGANRNFTPFFRPYAFWLRLVRVGDYLIGYSSTTGNSFTPVASAYIPMDACVEVGMLVFSVNNTPGSAVFSNVTVTGGSGDALSQQVQETINGISLKNGSAPQPGHGTQFDIPATEQGQAALFPNPTSGVLNIRFEEAVAARTTIVVRNQFGQALEQQQVGTGAVQTQLDVSTLPAGLYLLEVQGESGLIQTLRFTKQ
jgi:hypothetical protein